MPREQGERIVRCFHADADRPPHADDAYEFHWRCTATFQCNEGELPYCPYHAPIYTHSGRVTREDMQREQRAIDRAKHRVDGKVPAGRRVIDTDGEALTNEDMARLRAHRDEQQAHAKAKGLLP